jgi:hypothetical protein
MIDADFFLQTKNNPGEISVGGSSLTESSTGSPAEQTLT